MNRIFSHAQAGLTFRELLVAIVIVFVALFLLDLVGHVGPGLDLQRAYATQMLSNMKQLHLATEQMALDGLTTGDTNLGWPGDTGGSFQAWATNLVGGNYLSTNDLCKLLSGGRRITPPGRLPLANGNAILVYAVRSNSPATAIFLSSANFTNSVTGGAIDPSCSLLKDNHYIVLQKGGGAAIIPPYTNATISTSHAVTYPTPTPAPPVAFGTYVPLLR